jgi:hypothetical protein
MKADVIDRVSTAGGPVDVTRTTQAIDQQIARLAALRTAEVEPVVARLNDWKAAIQNQDLRNIETLRKQLGESFKAPELSGVRSTGEKALSAIYAPLREDMRDFIRTNGQTRDITKFEVANKRLAEMAGELRQGTLSSVLRRGDATPEAVRSMLFSNKRSDVLQLYRNLTPEGQARARTAILQEAASKAGGIEEISPAKFITQVSRLGRQTGVFFTGQDLQELKGLMRVLELTRRADKAGVVTETGQQAVPFVGAAALSQYLGGTAEAVLGAAAIGGAARAYESAPVRNILMKIPQTVAGSKEEQQLLKRLQAAVGQTRFDEQEEK